MNFRGLLFFTLIVYSCTPNLNNTNPSIKLSPKPTPSITFSPTIKTSPTSIPSITPSITISSPSSDYAFIPTTDTTPKPKPTGDIKEIRVYTDDGTMLIPNTYYDYHYYRMLPNETKKFNAEIIYSDGIISKENIIWESNNSNIFVIDNSGTLKTNVNGSVNSEATIKIYSKNNPSIVFYLNIVLVETLIDKKPIYGNECEITGYSETPIPRYFYKNVSNYGNYGKTNEVISEGTFNGKVLTPNGSPVNCAVVNAKAIDPGQNWVGETQRTINGSYVFRNAPVGARIAITVTKDGWTTRTRSEVLKSNLQGDPLANVFYFSTIYALQDEPEITSLKINGKQVNGSSNGDVFTTAANAPKNTKPTPANMDNGATITGVGNVPSLTGVNSDKLEVEMTFSEPINVDDVRSNFRITSQSGFDSRTTSFIINANTPNSQFDISADQKIITFKTNKALLANKGGDEARYLIDFTQPFRDKINKPAIDRRYFRFSPSQINDFSVFSIKNDETAPKLLGIVAKDGINGENDTIELKYSEPMELLEQASHSGSLSDPLSPLNFTRQLWYRDANNIKINSTSITNNTSDNNATLFGFLNNSDTDINQFRASYMIGRILASDITNGTIKMSILGNKDRTPNTTPVKGNTSINALIRNAKITEKTILLELSSDAFDRDDRVVVSVGNRITGNFVDRNRTPSLNEDLAVSTSGTAVEYASIYDPAGRLIDGGDSESRVNIDVNNSQRVTTAS